MSVRFVTEGGVDVPAVDAVQMREVDRIAMEETGPNLYQMMENAGRNLASLAVETLGNGWARATILVLAGPGGNGGGGICAARHLANHGGKVSLHVAVPPTPGSVPAFQLEVFSATEGRWLDAAEVAGERPDLILDALLGYGLSGAPQEPIAGLIRWTKGARVPIIALDLPSGVDATTGATPGEAIRPLATLTLALPKRGLADVPGEIVLADIGIPSGTYARLGLAHPSPFARGYRVPLYRKSV
jgi:NAD(P)H-hydrate epimerase